MAVWTEDTLNWLLEPDDPAVRHLALRDLLDRPPDDAELLAARREAHRHGPIAAILDAMDPAGYWEKPGPGYGSKYRSTVWAMITLAQCGASAAEDERVARACAYVLDHALLPDGRFTAGMDAQGNFDCLHGNLLTAIFALGVADPRLELAVDWAARSVTGEGIAPEKTRGAALTYTKYKVGPGFACAANAGLPCAWGAVKLLLALSKAPTGWRTPLVERAIRQGAEFLLEGNPARANYPVPRPDLPPDRRWFLFGFPVFYATDLLQNLEALTALGYGRDPRLAEALDIVRAKRDAAGRWPLEHRYYPGQIGWNTGRRGEPSKWITLRALRAAGA